MLTRLIVISHASSIVLSNGCNSNNSMPFADFALINGTILTMNPEQSQVRPWLPPIAEHFYTIIGGQIKHQNEKKLQTGPEMETHGMNVDQDFDCKDFSHWQKPATNLPEAP